MFNVGNGNIRASEAKVSGAFFVGGGTQLASLRGTKQPADTLMEHNIVSFSHFLKPSIEHYLPLIIISCTTRQSEYFATLNNILMMKKLLTFFFSLTAICSIAQHSDPPKDADWTKQYRATATKINDLVHTKVDVHFDYKKAYMYGKAWITLKPHFYPTDSLALDAKGMNINKVELVTAAGKTPLKYTYDSLVLNVKLNKTYKSGEKYTVYIDYVSKPNELTEKGSNAINDAKGLYFINPTGEDTTKPIEIWTQGETESTSAWLPTIDKPNQKMTNEIIMTVPDKYVTLSNGRLVSQTKNADGTRTDYWKMDLPHCPYLLFMGVGDYVVTKDTYKGKEVSYYVEKKYKNEAKKMFGLTPEMMKFYSEKVTGVEFPWNKYAQIVGTDYVSGAMENTTATLHGGSAQKNARELTDGNSWETAVAHELFHQWFGDYVTTESWSNITVNESMADYSDFLWEEYKYGADAAGDENYSKMQRYLSNPKNEKKNLVRFYYEDKEDVFDDVSYPKGGRILNMLRHYIGDSAFFKSLNLYLNTYKFGNGSAHKLRMAFEQVTGKDLNWYFNQWYFNHGHPKVEINYGYDVASKTALVYINQTQDSNNIFKLPLDIDIYTNGNKKRYSVWATNKADTFSFSAGVKPDWIDVDPDKLTLWQKKDNKTTEEFIAEYKYGKTYVDRREAINYCGDHKSDPAAVALLKEALNDKFPTLRVRTLNKFLAAKPDAETLATVEKLAKTDDNKLVRAAAIDVLSKTKDAKYLPLYTAAVTDSSYSVAGAALLAVKNLDTAKAISLLPLVKNDQKGRLKLVVESLEMLTKGDESFEQVTKGFSEEKNVQKKFDGLATYIDFLGRVNNTANFKKGIDEVVAFREKIAQYGAAPPINALLEGLARTKELKKAKGGNATELDTQIAYIKEKVK